MLIKASKILEISGSGSSAFVIVDFISDARQNDNASAPHNTSLSRAVLARLESAYKPHLGYLRRLELSKKTFYG